jgi:hypothetical protein
MKDFNTAKRDYFYGQQSLYPITYNIYDLEKQALSEALGETVVNVTDSWRKWFSVEAGYSDAYTANLSDLWYRWLGEQGFIGSLRDRQKAFYESTINLS